MALVTIGSTERERIIDRFCKEKEISVELKTSVAL